MMSKELIREKNRLFQKALLTLEEVLKMPESEIVRDASLQRFEYCFEMGWKLLKKVIEYEDGRRLEGGSTSVIKRAVELRILDAEDHWIDAQRSRNLTSHTYNQELAEDIYRRLWDHYFAFMNLEKYVEKKY